MRRQRISRRFPSRKPLSPFDVVAALLPAGSSWFDADNYTVDGVSGKTAAFIDRLDASHVLAQATAANQVAVPAADAGMKGRRSATFTGVDGQRYQSNRATALWNYFNAGATGGTCLMIEATNSAAAQSRANTRVGGSVGLNFYSATGSGFFYIQGTTGGQAVLGALPTTVSLHGGTVTAAGSIVGRNNRSNAGAGSITMGGTADGPFTLGSINGGGQPMQSAWRAVILAPAVLSESTLIAIANYYTAEVGTP